MGVIRLSIFILADFQAPKAVCRLSSSEASVCPCITGTHVPPPGRLVKAYSIEGVLRHPDRHHDRPPWFLHGAHAHPNVCLSNQDPASEPSKSPCSCKQRAVARANFPTPPPSAPSTTTTTTTTTTAPKFASVGFDTLAAGLNRWVGVSGSLAGCALGAMGDSNTDPSYATTL
ncbi:hypothetical protein VDGL01_05757 [Verticillium dahliae]